MPLGCFTMALLFLVFVGSILVIVFSAMKSTDVYRDAFARAKKDPAVIEAFGPPQERICCLEKHKRERRVW